MIVSDHGMTATGPDRVIWLDQFVAADALKIDEMSALLTAWPASGLEDSVYRALKRAPHLAVYRRAELPARFHLEGSPRVAPIVAIADEGWTIAQRTAEEPDPEDHPGEPRLRRHPARDARDLSRARGPAFRRGVTVPPFRNIHVYPLLAEVLGIKPGATDGSLDSVRAILAPSPGAN